MKPKPTHADLAGSRYLALQRLATARLKFSVDFNVGDPVISAPIRTAVPVLLGNESIEVLAYPKVIGRLRETEARLRRSVHARPRRPSRR